MATLANAQYDREEDATIPLKYFYIKKQKNLMRGLLSRLNFSVSTGYGGTTFNHRLEGFGIMQEADSIPRIFNDSIPSSVYSNWINKAEANPWATAPNPFMVSDTTRLGFRAHGFNIPFNGSVHVEFDRYRVGAGYSVDYMRTGRFSPITFKDSISSFSPVAPSTFLKKYFIMLGGAVYRYEDYLLVASVEFGGTKLGKTYDRTQVVNGIFLNFGARIERDLSEYFRVFVRPSYEFRNYQLQFPEQGSKVTHHYNTLYINVGATYRIPDLPRCFLKTCNVQIDHAHGNKVYRSRRHPFYKKQNPHYGENYPTLIKYKGVNKRKLNPY